MKLVVLFSTILFSISSYASRASYLYNDTSAQQIAALDFSKKVHLEYQGSTSTIQIKKCRKVTSSSINEEKSFRVISPTYFCAVNLVIYPVNYFFFFEENGKVYLRQVRTYDSRTYEVYRVRNNKVRIQLTKVDSIYPEKNKSL